MGLQSSKNKMLERRMVKNHVFQGVNLVASIFCDKVPKNAEWLVYFDPDVDGVIAGYLACKFLSKLGRKFSWYINSNREHGWFLPVDKVKGKNIIAVDFIITAQQLEELCSAGCNVINLDHHKNGDSLISTSTGVVVNNQYADEDPDCRYLSGAGVVFETLIQIDPSFDTLLNRQLVALTLLSDIRDIENPLAEGYLYKLYTGKYMGFLKYLIDSVMGDRDYGFGVPRMDRNYVDFKFSPAVNACFRFNRQDDVVNFFLGNKKLDLSWRTQQKELVSGLLEKVKMVEFPHLKVCHFYEKDILGYSDVLSSFVGLLASRMLDGQHSVICYMISENQKNRPYVKRASFRGRINGLDYNSLFIKEAGLDCRGHDSAFGIKGLNRPCRELFTHLNDLCRQLEKNSGYKRKVLSIQNMSFFVGKNAYRIADDNLYKLSQNQTVIQYTGNNIRVKRQGGSFIEYDVDGIPVMSFDLKLSFASSTITPILERGILTFYLE